MDIERAGEAQLGRICQITDQAKRQLRELGLDQWQQGYPSEDVWARDIAVGQAYTVLDDAGTVIGAFAFVTGFEPSYETIDGHWLSDEPYASVHRVCVSDGSKGKGIAGAMFAFAFEKAHELGYASVRIDTHPGNAPMKRALEKAGFQPCGTIRLADGVEKGHLRIAFEKLLP